MTKKKKEKRYKFTFGYGKKAMYVDLKDSTRVIFLFGSKALNVRYPKELVDKIIAKGGKKAKHYDFYWDNVELRAIMEGFKRSLQEQEKKKLTKKKSNPKKGKANGKPTKKNKR